MAQFSQGLIKVAAGCANGDRGVDGGGLLLPLQKVRQISPPRDADFSLAAMKANGGREGEKETR